MISSTYYNYNYNYLSSHYFFLKEKNPKYLMAIEGFQHRYTSLSDNNDIHVRLELTPTTPSPLSLDITESATMRIQRLINENPVIIFSRPSCCMCHVMKSLLSNIGVHPTVIELEEEEITSLSQDSGSTVIGGACVSFPAMFIGGACVGTLESLVALHLSNNLVPKLVEVGALRNEFLIS